ncbi:unnamed protein product, partial [marine sediment metagenome]
LYTKKRSATEDKGADCCFVMDNHRVFSDICSAGLYC